MTSTPSPTDRRRWLGTAGAVLLAGGLAACSGSARLRHVRALPADLRAPARRLLVVGISRQTGLRRTLEEAHLQALAQAGVPAVASHTLPSADQAQDVDGLVRLATSAQADAVALVKFLGAERTATLLNPRFAPVDPDGTRRLPDAWRSVWVRVHEPAGAAQGMLFAQTSVYRLTDGELLWSAVADVPEPGTWDAAAQSAARSAVAAMLRARVV